MIRGSLDSEPSGFLPLGTVVITFAIGAIVWVAAKYGKLSKVVDLALPKPKNENHPSATPPPGHNQLGPANGWSQQPQQGNQPYPRPQPHPQPNPAKHPHHPSPPPQNR